MTKKVNATMAGHTFPSTRILSARRAPTSLAAGVAAGVIPVLLGVGELAPLTVWVAASGMVLTWVWRTCWPMGPDRTKWVAEAEGESYSTDTAVIIGMSFAVSDSEPTSTGIRRVVLGHALLSYAFGTGVIAVTINLIANL